MSVSNLSPLALAITRS